MGVEKKMFVKRRFSNILFSFLMVLVSSSKSLSTSSNNIAVVGCGVLGTSFCKQILLLNEYKNYNIVGITKTNNNHKTIINNVVNDNNKDRFDVLTIDECYKQNIQFNNILFCAPPSGFDNYPNSIEEISNKLWKNNGGCFIFTSSGGIYGPGTDRQIVTESSEVGDNNNPRILKSINAESKVLKYNNGCCLRLAGLYTYDRGAHSFWLRNINKIQIKGRYDAYVNQLHYDDAASSCIYA